MGGGRHGGAEGSSARRSSLGFNLRRSLRVGAWNILSLSSDDRLPVLSRELRRLNVEIAALSEVRRLCDGEISSEGYTYFWSGSTQGLHHRGVAVAVSSRLASSVHSVTPIDERILLVRLKHTVGYISLIAVYAPTEQSQLDVKEAFYAKLNSTVEQCPRSDTLLVLGDFNAVTGNCRDGYEPCLGPFGSGIRNVNSSMFLDFAKSRKLRIAGSWFQRRDLHRWTWYSNANNAKKELDHVLISTRFKCLQNCRVYRSAEFFGTDHRLLVATLRIQFRSRRLPASSPKLDIDKLSDVAVSREYATEVRNRFEVLSNLEDTEALWGNFKNVVTTAARDCLGVKRRKKKSFVTEETLQTIERSRAARLHGDSRTYRALKREVQSKLSRDKEAWVKGIAEVVERNLWSGDCRPAYQALKTLSSQRPTQSSVIKAANGEPLQDPKDQQNRWSEYFEQLLTVEQPAVQLDTSGISPLVANPPISADLPSLAEVREAVACMKSGKAPGVCDIPSELLKAGGEPVAVALHSVVCAIWRSESVPTDWTKGLIVPIWKGKGDRQDCSNYRGVTLLSVPGKVFARLLLKRIRSHLLATQRPEQSGFTPKKSTTDRILALRVLIERRLEYRQKLLAAYVDLKKAFDSVHRESLWELLRLRGIPAKLISLISALYSDTRSAVKCGGSISDSFLVGSGVRQGCVLAPTLFSVAMDWVLGRALADHPGATIGDFKVTDLDFADDAAILSETLELLVDALESLDRETKPLGLQISWIKTKIQEFGDILDDAMHQVAVCGENVDFVDKFTYLGGVVHSSGSSELDVNRRIGLASGAMASLDGSVWRSRHLSNRTKIRIWKVVVLPVLLYGSDTWTLTSALKSRLNSFCTKSLRRILGYRWFDRVSNHRLLQEAEQRLPTCLVREGQLRLYGHVARFPEADPVRGVVACQPPADWRRPRGRPRANWLQQIDRYCQESGMGRVLAWGLAERDPRGWSKKAGAAKRCCGVCSHT